MTKQKLPDSSQTFCFEIEVTKSDATTVFGVGIWVNDASVIYFCEGVILTESSIVDEGEVFGQNDVISVHIKRIGTNPTRHQCKFMKNEIVIGQRLLDISGTDIKPLLEVFKEDQKRSSIETKNSLGRTRYECDFGMFYL